MSRAVESIDLTGLLALEIERAKQIQSHYGGAIDAALIAGSGVMSAFEDLDGQVLPDDIFPRPTPSTFTAGVQGHALTLSIRQVGSYRLLIFGGRRHLYEGYSISQVIRPVLLSHALNIPKLICTNAAGGLDPDYAAGDLMIIDSVLNRSDFHANWKHDDKIQREEALKFGRTCFEQWTDAPNWLRRGTYCMVSGPSYETRAEIRFFTRFAHAVGMSTVHELECASHCGLQTAALSIITNTLSAPPTQALTHDEVLETALRSSARVRMVVERLCTNDARTNAR